MKSGNFPALYRAADAASNSIQSGFLNSTRSEFAFLFFGAVIGLDILDFRAYYVIYALVFVVPLVIMLHRAFRKPEQNWYRARAVAESVKTLAWRYVMRAEPFQSSERQVVDSIFRDRLSEILKESGDIGEELAICSADADQITEEMRRVRSLSTSERVELYRTARIHDQRKWYAKKAANNRAAAKFWFSVASAMYAACIVIVVCKASWPELRFMKPDPVIVLATAIIGWMQIKRFSELSSSYALTAHEIGIVKMSYEQVDTEQELSEFVIEAEMAFSREHTQWVARR